MKRSCGRVALGKALTRRGKYTRRKICGQAYYSGLTLAKPPEVSMPRENTKSSDTLRMDAQRAREDAKREKKELREQDRIQHQKDVKERMAGESKERNQAAGLQPGSGD